MFIVGHGSAKQTPVLAGLDKHAYARTHVRENVKTMEVRTALLN